MSVRGIRFAKLLIIIVVCLIVVLAAAWIAAPGYMTRRINQELEQIGKYHGHIDGVELHPWDAGYDLRGLRVVRSNGKVPVPLLVAAALRISTHWGDLLRGRATARVAFDGLEVNLVDGRTEEDSQTGRGIPWWQGLERLARMPVDGIEVHAARIAFHNYHANPPIDLRTSVIEATVQRPVGGKEEADARAAELDAAAGLYGAPVRIRARFEPEHPGDNFALQLHATGVDVTRLNDYSRATTGVGFESGRMDLELKLEARAGHLHGSADPVIHDLRVSVTGEDAAKGRKSVTQFVRETIARVLVHEQKNERTGDVAHRVEIDADLDAAQPDTFASINAIVRETLRKTMMPSDGSAERGRPPD